MINSELYEYLLDEEGKPPTYRITKESDAGFFDVYGYGKLPKWYRVLYLKLKGFKVVDLRRKLYH